MWINYIGEIAMVFFVLLIAAHFSLHFIFKAKRRKLDRERAAKKAEAQKAESKKSGV